MHYNLYYILREDQKKHPISPEADARIRENLQKFFQNNQIRGKPK
jgi:hypothetical protein